jgi:hypothetical protein
MFLGVRVDSANGATDLASNRRIYEDTIRGKIFHPSSVWPMYDIKRQVKGGGHTANPGYSSTAGVHISLANFNEVNYDPSTSSVVIGGGLIWDDVYATLEPYGVNVVGGRVTGVGVAGFTLGGGRVESPRSSINVEISQDMGGSPTSTV